MANPTLRASTFTSAVGTGGEAMTLAGTQSKIALLTAICMGAGYFGWIYPSMPMLIGGGIVGFILAMVISFKPTAAPALAPVYAIAEGVLLGTVSRIYEAQFQGIVLQALLVTAAVFCVTLACYVMRIIRPTKRFVSIVVAATGGIFLFYLVSIVLGFFGIVLFAFGSLISILISVVICGIAAANLIIDYGAIETGVEAGAPKYMEWYSAFGLLVTVIWLYLEILRLLAKLQKRN